MQCSNCLKQIGLALHNYESTFGVWPRQSSGPRPGPSFAEPRGSWMTAILPYLEQTALNDQYVTTANWHDAVNQKAVMANLPVFTCPSAPKRDGFEWTVLVSYADATTTSATVGSRTMFPGATTDFTNVGGISSKLNNSLPPGQQLGDPVNSGLLKGDPVRMAEVTDGLSNTILVTECGGRPNLYQRGKLVSDGATPKTWSGSSSVTRPFPTGGVWASHSKGFLIDGAQTDGHTDVSPGPCPVNCSNDNEIYAFHPGRVNALIADGSVRPLMESVTLQVLVALVSRDGGEAVSAE